MLQVAVQRYLGDCETPLQDAQNSFLLDLTREACIFDEYSVHLGQGWRVTHVTGFKPSAPTDDWLALAQLFLDGPELIAASATGALPPPAYYSVARKSVLPMYVLGSPLAQRVGEVETLQLRWDLAHAAGAWPRAAEGTRQFVVVQGLLPVPDTGSYRIAFFTDHVLYVRLDGRLIISTGNAVPAESRTYDVVRFLARGYHEVEVVAVVGPDAQHLHLFVDRVQDGPHGYAFCSVTTLQECHVLLSNISTGSPAVDIPWRTEAIPPSCVPIGLGANLPAPPPFGSVYVYSGIDQYLFSLTAQEQGVPGRVNLQGFSSQGQSIAIRMEDAPPFQCAKVTVTGGDQGSNIYGLIVRMCDVISPDCDHRPGALCAVTCPLGTRGKCAWACSFQRFFLTVALFWT
jgi:hypothetical protein